MATIDPGPLRRMLRDILWLSLAALVVLFAGGLIRGSFGVVRNHLLNTFLSLAVGAFLADVHVGARRMSPRWCTAGLVAIVISQICFLLWVWTGWATEALLYRLWWISMVPSVASALMLVMRYGDLGRRDLIERGTPKCVIALGLSVMALALYRDLPPEPMALHRWLMIVLAVLTLAGSFVLWRRWVRTQPKQDVRSRRSRIAWLCVSHAAVLLVGLYIGRTLRPVASPFDVRPSALAGLSSGQLEAQVRKDLERLKTLTSGVDGLAMRSASLEAELIGRMRDQQRGYYLPEEDDDIRSQFMSYLSYRAALLRLAATYAGFESVRDPALKAKCFTVGYAAAVTVYQASLQLVTTYHEQPVARRKLNEPEERWGIPAGMYDRIFESVTNERNVELAAEMAAYFEHKRGEWREAAVWPAPEFDWLERRILDGVAYIRANRIDQSAATLELFLERVKQDAYTPMYAAQSFLAEWIGDTRVAQRPPRILIEQIDQVESMMKPGDIILERRNWCLSNAFLPGFWPHAALYVGHMDDLRRLGIADDPAVRARLEEYLTPASDGRDHTVIESVSEGVIFNSLTHSMHADYIGVLRPRLSEAEVAQAIARAFSHQGKPYDFEFDFFTSDKLVCTELVYRAYEGLLHFDLVRVMGRDTLPALEVVRKFAAERGQPGQQLDFVMFLDAAPGADRAVLASEDAFCSSADRPRAFNE